MSYEIFCILFLLIINFKFYFSSFNDEYPGIVICQNDNLQEQSNRDTSSQLLVLNDIIKRRCTHIQGSLYIRNVVNLKQNQTELNFDDIKEIDGHLVIQSNSLTKISLKNLRIIRGLSFLEHKLVNSISENFALHVTGNQKLITLDLSSLRSIGDHNVIIDNNPNLGYLPHKINWNELFSFRKKQRLVSSAFALDILNRDKCSPACRIWANTTQSYCWGPSDNQCQQKIRCPYNFAEDCETCKFDDNGQFSECCNEQCVGGCSGRTASNCMACKTMLNEKKCVESCPGPYTGGISGTTRNKEFKYHTGSFCSKFCPERMLPQESICVHKCHDGYFKNESNYCIRCYGDKCKNLPCDMVANITRNTNFVLNNVTLVSLKNCVKVRGYMVITKESFVKYNVTVPMLYENLNKMEDLEGGFHYYKDSTLKNLTFLRNLKAFRATNLHAHVPKLPVYNKFQISKTMLEFLGLKSLKSVIGPFLFSQNLKLCYMNIPWNEIGKGVFSLMPNNSCPGKLCHTECSHKGCWGPGADMCFECRHFEANGVCVSNCNKLPGFYFPVNISTPNISKSVCHRCHAECEKTCTGPGAHECLNGCINKMENGKCVPKCSISFFSSLKEPKLCSPCHSLCETDNNSTCTGSLPVPGPGGCNKCQTILLDKSEKNVRCVRDCPAGTFMRIKSYPITLHHRLLRQIVCIPCHVLCSACSDRSSNKGDCLECSAIWYKEKCVKSCPLGDSFGIEIKNNKSQCKTCHEQCLDGCSNSSSADCFNCKDKKIYMQHDSKLKKFYCDKTCPIDKPVKEYEKTGATVCLSLAESPSQKAELKRTKVTVAVVLAMFFLVIFVIIIIVVCLRRKSIAEHLEADLKAHYSNLTEPNSKDEDMLSKPPNMGRLVIVSKGDLTFEDQTRPLGFGAFGYVYKGKWKIPKEEDSLLRKSNGDFFLPVAIKVIKNMGNDEIESIMQEAKIMASVSHMHCLRFIGVCLSYEKPCLISAYVKEGSLDKYLVRNKSKITSLVMLSWSEQIADGMLYLTKRNIIHRDLAARNVLVTRLECVQITDFGLAKMLESTKEKEIIIKTGKVPIRWLAIETLTEGKYSHETDVWAYGVTLWEIFTFGKVPYEDQATHDIFDFVLKGGRLFQPVICSLDVYIIMVNCWLESPNLRPDFQSLMKTFMDYCKNPGRYLSIEGDPYEIPSPNNIEMTNLNNPYYGNQFNFNSATAETMLPLLSNRESMDRDIKHMNQDETDFVVSFSDKEQLPTRTNNRTSNLFKRFQDNKQSHNSINTRVNNTPQLASLASQEEPIFRNQSVTSDDDPRYVADPTDKALKIRQQGLKSQLLSETPRFHSNISRGNDSPLTHISHPQSHITNQDVDDYLEPITANNNSFSKNSGTDAEGYLEPVSNSNKDSFFSQDDYVVPSQPNSPTVSLLNNTPLKNSNVFKQSRTYLTMDEDNSLQNLHHANTVDDDEYLEPKNSNHLINSNR